MMPKGNVWRMWVAALLMFTAVMAVFAGLNSCAFGHDRLHPQYDDWYGSLKRPGMQTGFDGCCGKTDCHETEAELRGGDWWAQLGKPESDGSWALLDWVKIPAEVVLENKPNPTGYAVICHSFAWKVNGGLDPAAITIWCFIPPTES